MTTWSKLGLLLGLFWSTLSAFGQPRDASLEGIVLDAATRQPIAGATIRALTQAGKATEVKSAEPDGSFKLILSAKESYLLITEADGYVAAEERTAFSDSRAVNRFGKTIYLNKALSPTSRPKTPPAPAAQKPLTVGEDPMALRAIQFAQSTAEMVPEAQADLDRVLTFLTQNPAVVIEVAGHTDNQGNFDQNVALSRQRAEAVKTVLVGKGIAPARIQTRGYGGTRPVATNNYEKSRQLNRRVEVRVVKP